MARAHRDQERSEPTIGRDPFGKLGHSGRLKDCSEGQVAF
jgi:hypothetical protein